MSRSSSGSRYLGWLLAGSTASAFGDGIRSSALPMLAAATLGKPFEIAAVSAASSLPWLLFGLPVGACADRWDRRRMMISADLIRAGALTGAAILVATGAISLWWLLALTLTMGTGRVMFECASTALLPGLAEPANLLTANAKLMSRQTIGRDLIGQAVGGFLYAAGRVVPLLSDAATFVFSAVAVKHLPAQRAASDDPASLAASIKEGLRYVRRDRTLMLLLVVSLALNIVYSGQTAVFVIFGRTVLHLSPGKYGLVLAAGGAGGITASLLTGRLARRGQRHALLASVLLLGCSQLAMAAARGPYSLAVAYLATGAAVIVWNTVSTALRQTIVPASLLGRVTGASRLLAWGAAPAGALAAGLLTQLLGARMTLALAGAATLTLLTVVGTLPRDAHDNRVQAPATAQTRA